MINFKQHELIDEFFGVVKARFPEIELLGVTESPEDPTDVWINVSAPADEIREMAMMELASAQTADILQAYGYYLLMMPRRSKSAIAQTLDMPQASLQVA
jgi:hypothetical protein